MFRSNYNICPLFIQSHHLNYHNSPHLITPITSLLTKSSPSQPVPRIPRPPLQLLDRLRYLLIPHIRVLCDHTVDQIVGTYFALLHTDFTEGFVVTDEARCSRDTHVVLVAKLVFAEIAVDDVALECLHLCRAQKSILFFAHGVAIV